MRNHRLLVLFALAAGCGVAEDVDIGSAEQASCWNCGDGNPNGQGVVNQEGGNFCFATSSGPACVTAFVSTPKGVFARVVPNSNSPGADYTLYAKYNGVDIFLTKISADGSWLAATYADALGAHVIDGSKLAGLVLTIFYGAGGDKIDLQPVGPNEAPVQNNGVWEVNYYGQVNGGGMHQVCTDAGGNLEPASFVSGAYFDPMSAQRTADAAGVTTAALGCREGGIAKCMVWGYKPWLSAVNSVTRQSESLVTAHNACIQMKRAAYCGGKSYTRNGTNIWKHDVYNIQVDPMNTLEGVFTPNGAACVNMSNLRIPGWFDGTCAAGPLPACPSPSPLSNLWWLGKIASART